jgi:pyrroloquinoline quinone biosynthesis protein E
MPRPQCNSLAVEVTTACNQRCTHCYNTDREPGSGTGADPGVLEGLLEQTFTDVAVRQVTITGGEPLLYPGLRAALQTCQRHGVPVQIISNGSLLTDAWAEQFARLGVRRVQLTFNGPDAAAHDAQVGVAGQLARALAGHQALLRRGLNVGGCMVVTRTNHRRVRETLEFLRQTGIHQVALSRFSPAGAATAAAAGLLCTRSELLVALEQAESCAKSSDLAVRLAVPVPPCVADPADYPHLGFGNCPIGTPMQEFALSPDGQLRCCPLHHQPLGNLQEHSLAELMQNPSLRRYREMVPEFCRPCPRRAQCIGGCGAAAAALLGHPRQLDPLVAQHVDPALFAQLRAQRQPQTKPPAAGEE